MEQNKKRRTYKDKKNNLTIDTALINAQHFLCEYTLEHPLSPMRNAFVRRALTPNKRVEIVVPLGNDQNLIIDYDLFQSDHSVLYSSLCPKKRHEPFGAESVWFHSLSPLEKLKEIFSDGNEKDQWKI